MKSQIIESPIIYRNDSANSYLHSITETLPSSLQVKVLLIILLLEEKLNSKKML